MGVEDQLIDSFNQEDQLMTTDGGQKVNLWQSAANKAKDIYYQSLFSGGEKLMPIVEKTLGAESRHQAGLLLRYLSGSGDEMPLFEDQGAIDDYLQAVDKTAQDWKPTTNRELNPNTGVPYADEGWEYTQFEPSKMMKNMVGGENAELNIMIHDKLGKTSTVRRKELEGGNYEYMIVEPWDLIRGTGDIDVERGLADYTEGFGREIPKELAFLQKFAPDFLDLGPTEASRRDIGYDTSRMGVKLSDYGKDWIGNKAKPFNITGRSIINR